MAWDEFGRKNDFWIDFEKCKEDWAYRNKIREQNREIELKESTNKNENNMTTEEKQLLLKDLCARLPYGIYANLPNHHLGSHKYYIYEFNAKNEWTNGILYCAGREQVYGAEIEDIQPYLRPMSSMTEEELFNYKHLDLLDYSNDGFEMPNFRSIDWLLSHHFDFRGLIEKGLALEAPEGLYKE